MKLTALILAAVLLGTSIKGSPVVKVVSTIVGMSECSHSTDNSSCCQSSDQEDPADKCCGDMDCDCTCCVHILICTDMTDLIFAVELFGDEQPFGTDDYHREHLATVFHPPISVLC